MVSVKARPLLFPLRADNTHNHWRGLQDEELDPDRVVKRSAVHFRSFHLYSTVHAGYTVQLMSFKCLQSLNSNLNLSLHSSSLLLFLKYRFSILQGLRF